MMSKKQEDNEQLSEEQLQEEQHMAVPEGAEPTEEESSLVNELEQQKEKFIRLLAEFDNYKRRTARERLDIISTASRDMMNDLLPVLDDIDRAEQVIAKATDVEAVREGLLLISEKLRGVVSRRGLKTMEVQGLEFDAENMEAITEIPAGADLAGKVVEVIEKGYTLNDKIIRYAKVVVGKGA